ncbi:MAG TPA: hypothetical protein VFI28_02610 [Candidatus Limnocylindrales bacterium]|nr:hypothetical protein [Candidatus Limnocylindrales bacterium]
MAALVAHARLVPSGERTRIAARLRSAPLPGGVIVETCHRIELVGSAALVSDVVRQRSIDLVPLDDDATVRHVVRLAVGLDSAVVGEDQVLHQLRSAVRTARAEGPLDPSLDHLLDLALRAGRRARTWLPARRPNLADAALDALGPASVGTGRAILVVGGGPIGRLAVGAAQVRGTTVAIASRTTATAERIATGTGATAVAFDPGSELLARVSAVVVALAGPWQLTSESVAALIRSGAPVVDLSSPAAIVPSLATRLGSRLTSIDDLARDTATLPDGLAARLEELVERTVAEFVAWRSAATERSLARALADRADTARSLELAELWRRMPGLDADARAEIERMAAGLANRLLRDPLERLGEDADGQHRRAARELFRL